MTAVRTCLAILLLLAVAVPSAGARSPTDVMVRSALREATVSLDTGCSGAIAEHPQLIATALHCVKKADRSVYVRLSNGEKRRAWIVATDEVADQAVLFMEEEVKLQPLDVVRRPQIAGTVLFFQGHPERPRFQQARLDRVGTCQSLPALPNALFTSIEGVPGDSGAPLVDGGARIVGLVHGGAACHIATPASTLGAMLEDILGPAPKPQPVGFVPARSPANGPRACRAR
jgi:S1-C subfamily serine protease